MRHRSDRCCDGTQRLMGEGEGRRGTHCNETSTSSMNSSEVLTCTHNSNSLERGRGGREGKGRSGMEREKRQKGKGRRGERGKEEKR